MRQGADDLARPLEDEYAPYYATYVEKVSGTSPILSILTDQQRELQRILSRLDDEEAGFRYAPGKWSIKQVVGHLVDTERVFAYRAVCFARGEAQALPGMDQDDYVADGEFDGRPMKELAGECEIVRQSTIALFSGLSERQLERRGVASGYPFSTRALAFVIAGHERHHLDVLYERYGVERLS
ncbi:MAG: DinB family protein [Acidobacteriota bacterium]|nr:DinB family protein [Acidobacteriota bacterium]